MLLALRGTEMSESQPHLLGARSAAGEMRHPSPEERGGQRGPACCGTVSVLGGDGQRGGSPSKLTAFWLIEGVQAARRVDVEIQVMPRAAQKKDWGFHQLHPPGELGEGGLQGLERLEQGLK